MLEGREMAEAISVGRWARGAYQQTGIGAEASYIHAMFQVRGKIAEPARTAIADRISIQNRHRPP